ncbi:DNA-binding CsgD family transcriptional regulator [Sphingomonas zeicaulis]|uniref:helix-turn-helix transcriptional regulator n=1 Tax=Sphingomonas zeicaulis TaxID=1632740 RepID=UPI003D19AF5D
MRLKLIEELTHLLTQARGKQDLAYALAAAASRMGFDHFALAYDPVFGRDPDARLLVHDYPEAWARRYVEFALDRYDPVRRACQWALNGFAWRDLGAHICLSSDDRRLLSACANHGLADGFTVPRHLPGLASGACTFVVRPGVRLPEDMLVVAEAVGATALGAAHRLAGGLRPRRRMLSRRQRDCVLWSARGKSVPDIATILGIGRGTVAYHLRLARERYDVHSSEPLVLSAMFDGAIGFAEVLPWIATN